MTTLPTLTPCPKPDCKAPIAHWHNGGAVAACRFVLDGKPCRHDLPACYAPRETAPLHLPDVDAVAQAIYESNYGPRWDDSRFKDGHRRNARAALDLIAAHQPAWVPINVDDIRPGMRVRWVRGNSDTEGSFTVRDIEDDRLYFENGKVSRQMPYTWSVDPRTIPAEPVDPRVEVLAEEMEAEWPHCDDEWPCAGAERFRGAARRAIARLDEIGGEGK